LLKEDSPDILTAPARSFTVLVDFCFFLPPARRLLVSGNGFHSAVSFSCIKLCLGFSLILLTGPRSPFHESGFVPPVAAPSFGCAVRLKRLLKLYFSVSCAHFINTPCVTALFARPPQCFLVGYFSPPSISFLFFRSRFSSLTTLPRPAVIVPPLTQWNLHGCYPLL